MAHYAFIGNDNIVTMVIVGKDEDEDGVNWEEHYSNFCNMKCKRTSYNTVMGLHRLGKTPFRKNYAGIGYFFDEQRDAFIPPKPFDSWILNEESCTWDPPVPYPQNGIKYFWDELTNGWKEITQ